MRTPESVYKSSDKLQQRRRLLVVAAVLGCILLQFLGPATAMESEHYAINWSVMSGGGEPINSDNYALNATVGQPSIGFNASDTYDLCSGFWCEANYAVYLPIVFHSY